MIKRIFYNKLGIFVALFSLSITAKTEADVGIINLSQISMPSFAINQDLKGTASACVCSDAYLYNISIVGSGVSGAYTLINNKNDTIAFTIYWNDINSESGKKEVNRTLSGLTTNYTCADYTCNNQANSYLEVFFDKKDLMSAKHGTYSGYITITVEPN